MSVKRGVGVGAGGKPWPGSSSFFFLKEYCFKVTVDSRELKQLRGRPQRRLQKNKRVNDENNSSASA